MRIPDETESKNNERIERLLSELRVLENKNKRLVENEDFHSDLLSVISHELRTPLQTISGYVEMRMGDARYREFDQLNGRYLFVIQKIQRDLSQ